VVSAAIAAFNQLRFVVSVQNHQDFKIQVVFMKIVVLLALLVFSACQPQKSESQFQTTETASSSKQVIAKPTVASEFLISANGIGKAKLGRTLGELKQISAQNTKFEVVTPFMLNINAIAVSHNGLLQYYILYNAGTSSHPDGSTPTDNDLITFLMTDNYNYQTEEGVKVGMPIQQAENIYGDAILSYNVDGESGEYITFGNKNLQNIGFKASYFQLICEGFGFSAIYPEYPGVSYTTDKYLDRAAISAIEVSCLPTNCLN
jgi:hypothetical protein